MGRPSQIDLDKAEKLLSSTNPGTGRPWTQHEVAAHFGVTQQALSKQLAKRRKDRGEESVPPWPWRLASEHTAKPSTTYKLMLAYRRWAAGREVSKYELEDAKALQRFAQRTNMAITYRRDDGFVWVSRRPEDKDDMFVVR